MAPESAWTGDRGHATAFEDARVGLEHRLIASVEASGVGVEGVEVHHAELAPADQAHARPLLVAELGLDLVQKLRQLAIALHVAAKEVDHDLFVRGAEDHVALAPVCEAEQGLAHRLLAAALLPEVGGLNRRHEDLLAAGAVHLLAHDLLDLAQGALSQGHVAVDAGCKLLHQPSAKEELVRFLFGLGRRLPQRVPEESGHEHQGSILVTPGMRSKSVSKLMIPPSLSRSTRAIWWASARSR